MSAEEPPDELLGEEDENTLLGAMRHLDEALADRTAKTSRGLVHLATATTFLAAAMLLPYASDSLRSWQAWVDGEGVPVVRMFVDPDTLEAGMAVATGGAYRGARPASPDGIADQLGDGIAANLGDDGELTPPPPSSPEPGDPAGPSVRIDPSEYEGLVVELERPEVLRPFYEQLERTGDHQPGAITRIAHYGDSSIAGDGITSTARRRFQRRFGDAGHGFVLIARGTMPYRHQDIRHTSAGEWRLIQLVRSGLRNGHYGYGGVQYRGGYGTSARFGTSDRGPVGGSVSRYELWFQRHERGGRVQGRVDRGEWSEVSTRGETTEDGWHTWEVPDGAHRLEIRASGGGEARLYGMVLERAGPGVVYDSLGMVGARARRLLNFDEAHFAAQHAHRQTNLIILHFGGNDADDRRSAAQFERDFRGIARLARQGRPEAGCVVMAPLDQGRRNDRGAIVTMEQVPVIVDAARVAAAAEGCAFFDTYAAMGGEGSMRRWYRSNPRLAFGDLRHATPAGYQVLGNMLYKALLKGFAGYLEAS